MNIKKNLRLSLLSLVVFASLSSFIFLNFCATNTLDTPTQTLSLTEQNVSKSDIEMPDLQFIDHVFTVAKKIISAQ